MSHLDFLSPDGTSRPYQPSDLLSVCGGHSPSRRQAKRCQVELFSISFLFSVSPSTSLPFRTFFTCASQSRSFGPIDIRILQIPALRCCTFITRHDT